MRFIGLLDVQRLARNRQDQVLPRDMLIPQNRHVLQYLPPQIKGACFGQLFPQRMPQTFGNEFQSYYSRRCCTLDSSWGDTSWGHVLWREKRVVRV